jgi:adenylosuccinate lyase
VERVILPDSTCLVDYMLHQMTRILDGLLVYPERMKENMDRSYGLLFSQRVLLKLTDKGLARQKAYEMVQRNAMTAWRERTAFRDLLAADPEVMAHLRVEELDACFDPAWYLRNIGTIYRRVGLSNEGGANETGAHAGGAP